MTPPCWKGYEAFGFKIKDGKRVPNCIPSRTKNKNKNKTNTNTMAAGSRTAKAKPKATKHKVTATKHKVTATKHKVTAHKVTAHKVTAHKVTAHKVTAGILYLNGCGHCHALLDKAGSTPSIFDAVAARVQGKVHLVKIEASKETDTLKRLGLAGKVAAQGGYPTLFRHEHEHGRTTYFLGGERTVDALVDFFLHTEKKNQAPTQYKAEP